MNRRELIRSGGLALAGATLAPRLMAEATTWKNLFSAMGIASSIDKAATMKAAGAEFLTESVGSFLVPDQPDDAFEKNLAKFKESPLPILACNGFIRPANLHCVGPEANHDAIMEWSETSFRRLKQAVGKFIVFGSGGSRRIPDGWPREKADEQFIALLKRMGPLAEKHGIKVTVEQLQAKECNFINHVTEAAAIIRAVAHPHIRMLADLFHMTTMGDTPADLKASMDVIIHIEIAEKNGRTVPGVSGEDFRPYFHVLREAGYQGAISIEGKYTTESQLANGFQEITKQAAEA